MLLAALMAGVLTCGIVQMEARGQTSLTQLWEIPYPPPNPLPNLPPREHAFNNDGTDQGVAMASYLDSGTGDQFLFVTGWGTNMGGGTHIVTYKYDVTTGERVGDPAYFPSHTNMYGETINKPTSIVVNQQTGDVYVAG